MACVQVLQLIGERANICNQLHLPAQAGDDGVLAAMGRGYTVEAYRNLVDRVRTILPGQHHRTQGPIFTYLFMTKIESVMY